MKNILIINIILLLFIQQQKQINATESLYKIQQSERIVDGNVIYIKEAKFVVYIRKNGKFHCGGALITPKYVVTAAHCFKGVKQSALSVIGGATYLSEKGVKRNISKIFLHKEYNPHYSKMDIAVLELSKPMKGAKISPIELCRNELATNDQISVYGWGQMSEHNVAISNQLRMVNVPIVDRKKCEKMYWKYLNITSDMFCAADLKGKDSCNGDSGGPAVFHNQLCGVVSWGIGCGRRKFPGVYANIMYVRDFINEIIEKE